MARFTPKSEKELSAERLIPAGIYDFTISKAEDKKFKTGSEGIALTVTVYLDDGAWRLVNDNLVFSDAAMFKVSNFAKAVGIYEQYKAGEISAEDCEGKSGKVKIGIEPEGEYPAKNKVASYVVPKEKKPASSDLPKVTTPAATEDTSDVPF